MYSVRTGSFKRMLSGNDILALDEAAGVLPRLDVPEDDVALDRAKEWDPGTDEHGNARDNESPNYPRLKESLNGDPSVHVDMSDSASGKLRHDFGRRPRHPVHHSP